MINQILNISEKPNYSKRKLQLPANPYKSHHTEKFHQ